jgi:hypothetical protein
MEEAMKTRASIALILALTIITSSVACAGLETVTTPSTSISAVTTTNSRPASEPPTEKELREQNYAFPELPRITAYQLNLMLESGDPVSVVDVRLESLYKLGHLPAAVNITTACTPDPAIDDIAAVKLMARPRDRLVVLY